MVINPYIFKREPNTFIGGIAKLGGTGANAPILTAAELATKLGISVNNIKGFKVVGEDVECRITSDYILKTYAFGHQLLSDANQNITYFHDFEGKVKYSGYSCFRLCQNLTSVILNGYLSRDLGGDLTNAGIVTSCNSLNHCELNSLVRIDGYNWFSNLSFTILDLPNLEYILNHAIEGYGARNFYQMPNIEILKFKKLKMINEDPSINYLNFNGIKLNATIEVHIDLATANNGDIDADLLYAYTSRNATINFYDDNGNFVETYNPNPPNEIDWTVHPSPEPNDWSSIATDGNGTWIGVAINGTNRILKSIDNGVTWTVQVTPENNSWQSIATDGNGTWIGVAASGTNRILKSIDNGVTWTVQVTPENNFWWYITTDGNGIWIGVTGTGTNRILKSIDNGVTWTVQPTPENNTWRSISTDGNGTWIGVANSGVNQILKSIDNGLTWTVQVTPENNTWRSIATDGNGTWIVVANSGVNQILKSIDNGLTWTVQVTPENNSWWYITTDGNGTWIGVAASGTNRILKSVNNGLTWSVQPTPENNQWYSIATDGNGTWIGVSSNGTNRILKGIEVY